MKHRLTAFMAILALGVSCTKEIKENAVTSQGMHTLQTKLVGGNDGEIIPGSILVKLDQETSGKKTKQKL